MKNKVYILSILILMLLARWWIVDSNSFMATSDFLFVTENGKMNWIGLTGIIAVFGLFYNLYDGRRRFRGDILSKSRIDWMKSVRPLLARYTTDISNYLFLYHKFIVDDEPADELNKLMRDIRTEYYELLLYIPNNDSNRLLLKNINLLFYELNNTPKYYDYGIRHGEFYDGSSYETVVDKYVSDLIEQTIREGSAYFKKEWVIAKSGN